MINIFCFYIIFIIGEVFKVLFFKVVIEEERKKELVKFVVGVKEEVSKDEEGEMEWGNVLVYGCERDCVGIGEEWIGVEWEVILEL